MLFSASPQRGAAPTYESGAGLRAAHEGGACLRAARLGVPSLRADGPVGTMLTLPLSTQGMREALALAGGAQRQQPERAGGGGADQFRRARHALGEGEGAIRDGQRDGDLERG